MYSNTKWSLRFLLNTSSKFTKLLCFNCCGEEKSKKRNISKNSYPFLFSDRTCNKSCSMYSITIYIDTLVLPFAFFDLRFLITSTKFTRFTCFNCCNYSHLYNIYIYKCCKRTLYCIFVFLNFLAKI